MSPSSNATCVWRSQTEPRPAPRLAALGPTGSSHASLGQQRHHRVVIEREVLAKALPQVLGGEQLDALATLGDTPRIPSQRMHGLHAAGPVGVAAQVRFQLAALDLLVLLHVVGRRSLVA